MSSTARRLRNTAALQGRGRSVDVALRCRFARTLPRIAHLDVVPLAATGQAPSKSGSTRYRSALLDIIVEMELVRVGTQPDGIDFAFSLVVEPGFDHVSSEHISP